MEVLSHTPATVSHKIIPVETELRKPANMVSFLFIVIHIPLALFMSSNSQLSTMHAYVVLATGIIACIINRLDIAAACTAYIVGAEVLWRMTGASVFWEFGKYASLAIYFFGIIRSGIRNSGLPFVYFSLLVPSAILTVEHLSFSEARNDLSFNLSGPLALLGSVCFFSGLSFNKRQMWRIFIAMLAPIAGIAAIAIFSTFTTSAISFGDESNRATSGRFGPNQVSSMLGLGVLTTFISLIAVRSSKFLKISLILLGTILLIQCLLTFSRGGVYVAVPSMFVAALILVRQPRKLVSLFFGILVIGIALTFWILPWLNSFTGGTLSKRYKDTGSTGRLEIVQDDLRIWRENPILGVGPGRAEAYRYLFHRGAAAHTEYTRMLAEHGILGLAAMVMLFAIAIRNFRRANSVEWKAVTASFLFWSLAYMVINAMRLVAPSFLVGLSTAQISEEDEYVVTEQEMEEVDS